jgi:ProP effector
MSTPEPLPDDKLVSLSAEAAAAVVAPEASSTAAPAGTEPEVTAAPAEVSAVVSAEPALAAALEAPVSDGAPAAAVAVEPAAPAIPELTLAQCAARLAELFPALFAPPAKPIKLRIQADIQTRAPGVFSRKSLSVFLHRHTTSTAYLKSLVNLGQRFDLDGVAAGEVAAEHREAAGVELARRRSVTDARREAERQAQRQAHREAERARRQEVRAQPGPAAVQAEQAEHAAPAATAPRQPPVRHERPQRPPRHERPDRPARPDRPEAHDRPPREEAPAPQDAERRERAVLLRTFEGSSLTKANFCVLKRISEAELDAQLQLAREEAKARAALAPPAAERPAPWRDDRARPPARPQHAQRHGPAPQRDGPRRPPRQGEPKP